MREISIFQNNIQMEDFGEPWNGNTNPYWMIYDRNGFDRASVSKASKGSPSGIEFKTEAV